MVEHLKTNAWIIFLIRGREYFHEKDFLNAYNYLTESIYLSKIQGINKENCEAYFLRAIINREWYFYEDAILDFRLAIKAKPEFFAYYEKSNIYLIQKKYKKAIFDLTKALKLKPNDFNSLLNRGACNYEIGRYKKAINDFNKAEKIKLDTDLFFNRGLCYSKLRNYKSAISDFNLAINLGYRKGDIFFQKGIAKSRKKDYKNAISDFKKAIYSKNLENKELGCTYLEKGWAHIRIGEFKKGLQESDKGEIIFKAKGNEYFLHLINKAYTYIKLSKMSSALSVLYNYSKYDLKLEKHQIAFLLMLRGLSLTLQGDHNEALKDFEKMFLKDPDILEKDEESIFDEVPEYMKNLIRISLCINLN